MGNNQQNDSKETKYYKSHIGGLSVQFGDQPDRDQLPQEVRFTPYSFKVESTGDTKVFGYLKTDETDVIEILADDVNVSEVKAEEYKEAIKTGKPVRL